jgi:hypothetical protein
MWLRAWIGQNTPGSQTLWSSRSLTDSRTAIFRLELRIFYRFIKNRPIGLLLLLLPPPFLGMLENWTEYSPKVKTERLVLDTENSVSDVDQCMKCTMLQPAAGTWSAALYFTLTKSTGSSPRAAIENSGGTNILSAELQKPCNTISQALPDSKGVCPKHSTTQNTKYKAKNQCSLTLNTGPNTTIL